jgi:methylmalonyl-CoA mutase cobalamin-binding subunit
MLHEILISVIATSEDEAHEAIVQLAESRGSDVLEVVAESITPDNGDEVEGYCVQARLTPGQDRAAAV